MYTASVSSSEFDLFYLGLSIIAISFIVLIVRLVIYDKRKKSGKNPAFNKVFTIFVVLLLLGVVVALVGRTGSSNATIEIGTGYVAISGPVIGSKNYSSSNVSYAYVENINSGNLTLSIRNLGTSIGNYNEGMFTLSNGESADVLANNATVLLVQLSSGGALVLGTSNTTALANAFNSEVHAVSGM